MHMQYIFTQIFNPPGAEPDFNWDRVAVRQDEYKANPEYTRDNLCKTILSIL